MKPSWARKQIGLIQLDTQKQFLRKALYQVQRNMRPETDARVFDLTDELRRMIWEVDMAKKSVMEVESREKFFWSDWIVGIYKWATKERFSTK